MRFIHKRFQILQPLYQFDELVDFLFNKQTSVIKKVIIRNEYLVGQDITELIQEIQLFTKIQNLTPNLILNDK